jgi:hypothetical protein
MALPIFKLGLAAAAGYYFYNRFRKSRGPGSTTNASDAVDDVKLGPNPTVEEKLDEGVKETFPASDPVSVAHPSETAYERKQREQSGRAPGAS